MTRIWEIKLMDRIEEIRAREQAATKGPWRVWGNAVDNWTDSRAMSFRVFAEVCTFWKSPGDDLQFIAKSREDIPFLLARVAELEREVADEKCKAASATDLANTYCRENSLVEGVTVKDAVHQLSWFCVQLRQERDRLKAELAEAKGALTKIEARAGDMLKSLGIIADETPEEHDLFEHVFLIEIHDELKKALEPK